MLRTCSLSRATTLVAALTVVLVAASARAQETPPAPDDKAEKPDQPAAAPDDKPGDTASTEPAKPAVGTSTSGGTTTTTEVASVEDLPANVRLRRLEQRVQALKEQAWRVKARVGMLKEAVLGGGIGARAGITHVNKMGGSFRLIKLVYALDGTQVFARSDDTGKLHDQKNIDILSGPIAPGNHTISVLMLYRGHGYGVFAYLKSYKFTVRSSHTFTVSEGKMTQVTVVGYERGGVTTPLEKRPAVDFKVNVVTDRPGAEGK
jgi:hypothetical protein